MGYLKAPKINTSARLTSAWAASELLYDTDLNAFFKGDGVTTGGVRLAEGDLASVLSIISALEARVSALSATPAGVSVTSNKLSIAVASAVSNLRSVINVVSNTVSSNNAARISANNALSNAISVVSNALSVETQTRSSQNASINSEISNLKSVISSLSTGGGSGSVTSAHFLSVISVVNAAHNTLSNQVSSLSAQLVSVVNVVSNAVSSEAASRVSADNVLSNQISNALSVVNALNLSKVASVGASTSLEIQTSGIKTPHVQFDPLVSSPTTSIYSLTKDFDFNLLNYQVLSVLGIKLALDDVWPVKNQTGVSIPKGTPVMAVGTLGSSGRILIDKMAADGSVSPIYLLGVTAEAIPDGADGICLRKGKIIKHNTATWPNGTVLYCDPATPGGFTSSVPTAPNLKLPIAFVVNSDTTNGVLAIRITEGARLRDDHDVQFTSTIPNGDLIAYNLSANRWENFTPDYATFNQLSAVSAQAASAINVVSNALSVETQARISTHTALSNTVSNLASVVNALSAAAGNSVTSAEVAQVLSNALSAVNVVSNALSLEIFNRISADNALSNVISSLNSSYLSLVNRVSVNSIVVSVTSNELSAVSAQAASAISVLQNNISIVSNAVSVVSVAAANALSVANAASNAVSIVSVALANEISARAAADTNILSIISVLEARVSANSGTGGSGSVTSNELSIALNVSVFNTAGTSVRGLQSVINALSNRISAISGVGGGGSVTSAKLSAVSAQAQSAINVVSNAVSIVSVAHANTVSVLNALSNKVSLLSARVSTLSNTVSILSNRISQETSNRNSAINALSNSLSNTKSALSVDIANALSVANAASNAASIVSVALANELSVRAAADNNILSIISVLEARVSANSGTGGVASVTSNELSIALNVSVFNTAGTSVRGLQSVINALSNKISTICALAGNSVTSAELAQGLSVVSAQAASAISVINERLNVVSGLNTSAVSVEGLQSVINALSNRISVISSLGGGGGDVTTLAQSTTQTGPVNTTTETAIFSHTLPTDLAAGETLVLDIAGELLNNTGGGSNIEIAVKLGTTSMLFYVSTQANSSTKRSFFMQVRLFIDSTSSQKVMMSSWAANANTGSVAQPTTSFNVFSIQGYGTASEDTTSAKTFQVTAKLDQASANFYVRAEAAVLTRISAP